MSSTTAADPTTRDGDDFDAAIDAYVEQSQTPAGVETGQPAAARRGEARPDAGIGARREAAPAAPAETAEPDDDDEALEIDQRFARAQRREQKRQAEHEATQAKLAEAEAARQRAQSQVYGYQGRMKQLEGERDQFRQQATDQNAALNKIWEDGIAATDDPGARAELQRRYDVDRRERDLAQKEAQQAFAERQRAEDAQRRKATLLDGAVTGMRTHAIPDLIAEIGEVAGSMGLPATEYAHMAAHLRSDPVQRLVRTYTPEQLHEYRTFLADAAMRELTRVKGTYDERRTAANREEARGTYRPERPVGAGGGQRGKKWEDMDFDEAIDAMYGDRR